MNLSPVHQLRNRAILQFLADSQAYTANDSLLLQLLNEDGYPSTQPALRDALIYLAEIGLVETHLTATWVAQLTERGLDVAQGRAAAYGVAKPLISDFDPIAKGQREKEHSRLDRLLTLVAKAHKVSRKKVVQVAVREVQDEAILQSLSDVFETHEQ